MSSRCCHGRYLVSVMKEFWSWETSTHWRIHQKQWNLQLSRGNRRNIWLLVLFKLWFDLWGWKERKKANLLVYDGRSLSLANSLLSVPVLVIHSCTLSVLFTHSFPFSPLSRLPSRTVTWTKANKSPILTIYNPHIHQLGHGKNSPFTAQVQNASLNYSSHFTQHGG